MADVTPVTLLTGLSAAAAEPALRRLEAAGISVLTAAPATMRWTSGCACCAPRDDVARGLRTLLPRARRDEVRLVAIVALGPTDPGPILATLLSDTVAASAYRLDSIIAVLDGTSGLDGLVPGGAPLVPLAMADRIVLSGAADSGPLESRLRQINPGARVVSAADGLIDPGTLLHGGLTGAVRLSADLSAWLDIAAFEGAPTADPTDSDIQSFSVTAVSPPPWPAVLAVLERLVLLHGDAVLRMKAILSVQDRPGPVVVHSARHLLFPPLWLKAWPAADPRISRIALIAKGGHRAELQAKLGLFGPAKAG